MKKILFLFALILLTASVSVCATYTLTGTAPAGEQVSIKVFKYEDYKNSDGSFLLTGANSALENATYMRSVLAYANQTEANSDGSYSFDIKIGKLLDDSTGLPLNNAVSERYVAVLRHGSTTEEKEFLYVDPDEMVADFITLAGMKNDPKSDVITFLQGHKYALGAYDPIMAKMNPAPVYEKLYSYLTEVQFDVADAVKSEKAKKDFQKLIIIEALNQGKIEKIADYEGLLRVSENSVNTYYTNSKIVTNEFKSTLLTYLTGKSIADLNAFDTAFRDGVILGYVYYSDGLDGVKGILEAFKTTLWNDLGAVSDDAYRSVMGVSYASTDLLKAALLSYTPPVTDDDDDDGGYIGGGGGGGGGGRYNGLTLPATGEDNKAEPIKKTFSDIDKAPWAEEAITYMAEKGYVSGRGDGTFDPSGDITRAEFVKIIVGAFGLSNKAESVEFNDVADGDWYREFVAIAYANGIARGQSETYFGANEKISRQDMSVMLYNTAKLVKGLKPSESENVFSDGENIADYAKEAVYTLYKAGVINGYGDGNFAPTALATRAQAVKMIYGMLAE